MLDDKPIYEEVFSTYANISFSSNMKFEPSKGTDITTTTANVIFRYSSKAFNLSLNDLFIKYNNNYYKVSSEVIEDAEKGYLKCTIISNR
jgi:hypothetical protein